MKIGLDIGSTTLKCVVLNEQDEIQFSTYERHFSQITGKTAAILREVRKRFPGEERAQVCISGSAGMGIADSAGIPFVQEVYATRIAVNRLLPGTDTVIELGGEDAKILFLTDGLEVRMNGSCAGGTGAFIDQMATLLDLNPDEMNELAKSYEKIYTVASRCGVFAKSDIQPLLNQGARKNDISASIFAAVVNQTVAGLAQGREIGGQVVYLGGPLSFLSQLRAAFDSILHIQGICPENSLYFVALGAAFVPQEPLVLEEVLAAVESYRSSESYISCAPLFENQEEYKAFALRHAAHRVPIREEGAVMGPVYLGIDAGSTTVKAVVTDEEDRILCSRYLPNSGNPVPHIREFIQQYYHDYPLTRLVASAATGYGEEMIKNAFQLDYGVVETIAHFTAAKKFNPQVDFIIDIGGQDIKCFKIRDGVIDNIFLNEACSSGCGSFLQTFAGAWNYSIGDFAKLGLFADRPVDLGSRCTVFMNSSVKQAQKDGASIENISAGLSISVVKNALYKVIRAASADALGQHIVVQGGTFLNDAVLRAFEKEIGRDVIRPNISGLMGAYGAALYAKERAARAGQEHSGIVTPEQLATFVHEVKVTTCGGCSNHCRLTINTFGSGRRFVGGNRCDKPLAIHGEAMQYNMYEYKRELLSAYGPREGKRGTIGIPMGLNNYELLPFWHTLFTKLGFTVVTSPASNRKLYLKGQHTIPSDTVCFPAKLMHGHVEELVDSGVSAIFYPCLSYNLDENLGDNHYNCPVVAYYPEVIQANVPAVKQVKFICDYLGIHRPKDFARKFHELMEREFGGFTQKEVVKAVKAAYAEQEAHMGRIHRKGEEFLRLAREKDLPVVILAGRPYHIDPEISHGIDKLVCDCGAVVISEDGISQLTQKIPTTVLNQWTYHSRLYAAADFVARSGDKNLNLVQLVSFGCGVDAITTDEVRAHLENAGRIYTQIKIDEITNLGAVKIRLRSLFAALEQEQAAGD